MSPGTLYVLLMIMMMMMVMIMMVTYNIMFTVLLFPTLSLHI